MLCLLHSFIVFFLHYLVILYYLSLLPFTANKDEYIDRLLYIWILKLVTNISKKSMQSGRLFEPYQL